MTKHPATVAFALLLSAWGGGAWCAGELPRSPACQRALQALQQAEDVLAAASAVPPAEAGHRDAVAAKLRPQREQVSRACLGGLDTGPSPSQHSVALPTTRPVPQVSPVAPVARVQAPKMPAVVVPPPRVEAPVTVSNCNAATCLGSDGSTLTRVGPNLVGPRGTCTKQGVFVSCP